MGYAAVARRRFSTWITTLTGFTVAPTPLMARHSLDGKLCAVAFNSNTATSNATTFTITLPFAAANTASQYMSGIGSNNGNTVPAMIVTRVNSNIADVYICATTITWTASGAKGLFFNGVYETV